jgi:hypothetical protein
MSYVHLCSIPANYAFDIWKDELIRTSIESGFVARRVTFPQVTFPLMAPPHDEWGIHSWDACEF